MPKITIDDRPIEVAAGTTIIQAADKLGLFIPHYCYHPGLPVAGSCRMCLVEVEKAPKLQIACYTFVTDGMVVRTTTQPVATARAAILEFLLANHPLDCPVCDQAGECKLQEFYMQFGRYDSTMLEDKTKKHKQLPVGPHIMLDSERCILCSRCTRFVDDITHTHELGIFNRGAHSELLPVEGAIVDNAYSGCLADICPVGALTDRDFRFKIRVWYLDKTDSVCHGCARGCNVEIHTNRRRSHHNNGKFIARYKPRFNAQVNGYWMCDAGRYSYKDVESPERLLQLRVLGADGQRQACDWLTALAAVDESVTRAIAAHGVAAAAVIAAPSLSNEELWAVRRLWRDGMKIPTVAWQCPADPEGVEDELLRKADTFPNSFGAEQILGKSTKSDSTVASVLQAAVSGRIRLLFVLGDGLTARFDPAQLQQALAPVDLVVAIQSHHSILTDLATIVLPVSTYAETEGTITNFAGQVQRYWPAIPPLEASKPLLDILADLANRWELPFTPREPELCFAELAGQMEYFAGLSYRVLGWEGVSPLRMKVTESTV